MSKNLSVRGLEDDTLETLKGLAHKEGSSVNALVLRLIEQGIGKRPGKPGKRRYDDLDALAGAWTGDEAREIDVRDGRASSCRARAVEIGGAPDSHRHQCVHGLYAR